MSTENSRRMQMILRNAQSVLNGMGRDEIAKYLGERSTTINAIASGSLTLSDEQISRWAESLGVSVKELVAGPEEV